MSASSLDQLLAENEQLRRRVAELEERLASSGGLSRGERDSQAASLPGRESIQQVADLCPAPMIVSDPRSGRVLAINQPFLEMAGARREDVVGKTAEEIGWWSSLGERDEIIRQVREHGHARGLTGHFVHADGGRRTGRVSIQMARFGEAPVLVAVSEDITEQENAKKALEESEVRLRWMTEQIPAILWSVDKDLRFTSSTGEGLKPLGLKPNEVVGQSLYGYFRTSDPDVLSVRGALDAIGGRNVSYEVEWGGQHYRCLVQPLRNNEDEITGAIGVALDITDYRRTQDELRASEQRWRSLVENAPDVILSVDRDGIVNFINQTLESYSKEEVIGAVGVDFLLPGERESPRTAVEEVYRTGQRKDIEIYEPRQGCWFSVRIAPVIDGDRVVDTVVIATDITEQKRSTDTLRRSRDDLERRVAERAAALEASENRFRIIATSSPVAVVISRIEDGLLMYGNARVAEMFGLPQEEILGRKAPDFYQNPIDRQALLAELEEKGSVRDHEVPVKRADGTPFWVSVSMQPIEYRGEQAVLAAFLDVTERHAAAESLQRERRLLKHLIDLHERDRQLVAYEIHDGIVQDMSGAMMYVETAKAFVKPDEARLRKTLEDGAKALRESIGEARRLINGLRLDVLEEMGVVAAVDNLIQQIAEESGIEIEFEHRVDFDRIAPALEMSIFRIIQESLNNVRQHSQADRAMVQMFQHGERLKIHVRDWGIGFDPTKVRKHRYGIVGLQERARLMGGQTKINSVPGQGTRLDVDLPLTDVLLPDK